MSLGFKFWGLELGFGDCGSDLGFEVLGLRLEVWAGVKGSEFAVWALGFRFKSLGNRAEGTGLRVLGSEFECYLWLKYMCDL